MRAPFLIGCIRTAMSSWMVRPGGLALLRAVANAAFLTTSALSATCHGFALVRQKLVHHVRQVLKYDNVVLLHTVLSRLGPRILPFDTCGPDS